MPANKHFVFYANASATIGSGHIMRLFAIAQVCIQQSISVTFLCRQCPESLHLRLLKEGFTVAILDEDFSTNDIQKHAPHALFIDDYSLNSDQWQVFKNVNALMVNLDDNIDTNKLISNIIINPAADANERDYRQRAFNATFCLGPKYTYLRQEFAQQSLIALKDRPQLLITLGGADVKNMAYWLSKAILESLKSVEVCLLLGSLNTSAKRQLAELKAHYPRLTIVQQSNEVAALMMRSGLAISAAGGTLGELACMGVPTIALVSADNQLPALKSPLINTWYKAFDVRKFNPSNNTSLSNQDKSLINIIINETNKLWLDLCKRQVMSDHARQIIDSDGCQRIVHKVLEQLSE